MGLAVWRGMAYDSKILDNLLFMDESKVNVIKWAKRGGVAVFAIIILWETFGTIDAGERGVKTRLGAVVGIAQPRLYVKFPFI